MKRLFLFSLLIASRAFAQESPYFITYDHHMEEPGSLELSIGPMVGVPREGNRSLASAVEFE